MRKRRRIPEGVRRHFRFLRRLLESAFVELEVAALRFQDAVIAHFRNLVRHGASVNGQVIGQLLPVERNGYAGAVLLLCFFRQVRDQFIPGRSPGHIIQLLNKPPVLLGYRKEQILHDRSVKTAR